HFFAGFGGEPVADRNHRVVAVGDVASQVVSAVTAERQEVPVARPKLTLLKSYLIAIGIDGVRIEAAGDKPARPDGSASMAIGAVVVAGRRHLAGGGSVDGAGRELRGRGCGSSHVAGGKTKNPREVVGNRALKIDGDRKVVGRDVGREDFADFDAVV